MVKKGEFRLRFFKRDDLGAVMDINLKILPENYTPGFFLELYRNYPKTFIVAEVEGRIVGYVMCRIERAISLRGFLTRGHVVSIAVLPNYRRRGIGTALMEKAMEGMIEYGAKEAYLEVRTSNIPAMNLYRKLGFRVTNRILHYYFDGEDAFVMTKELRSEKRG
jgi:ribosomal-protein-alanine N-acetyltransferase